MNAPRADFYLIDKPRYRERPLLLVCKLVEKVLLTETPLLVLARDHAQAEEIDDLLWAYDEQAFIPHQLAGNADDAEVPVLIVPPDIPTEPRPMLINLREDTVRAPFQRVLEVIPADPAERKGTRQRWINYRNAGIEVHKHDM